MVLKYGQTQEQFEAERSEASIEQLTCRYAERKNTLAEKFTSPNRRSVPDRIFTFPLGQIVFVEFKKKGKKPTTKQAQDHERRRALKQIVLVIDNVKDGKAFVDAYTGLFS